MKWVEEADRSSVYCRRENKRQKNEILSKQLLIDNQECADSAKISKE